MNNTNKQTIDRSQLTQTKTAIAALLKAGLRRQDFQVRTEKDSKGEYKPTYITIKLRTAEIEKFVQPMVETGDLWITKHIAEDGRFAFSVYNYPFLYGHNQDDRLIYSLAYLNKEVARTGVWVKSTFTPAEFAEFQAAA